MYPQTLGKAKNAYQKLVILELFLTGARPNHTKRILRPQFTNDRNKLECLLLASLSSLILRLRVRLEPTQIEHLKGTPL